MNTGTGASTSQLELYSEGQKSTEDHKGIVPAVMLYVEDCLIEQF